MRWELCFIQKDESWGMWSEKEGGHGLMLLLNGHPQTNARETRDLSERT